MAVYVVPVVVGVLVGLGVGVGVGVGVRVGLGLAPRRAGSRWCTGGAVRVRVKG